MRLYLDLGSTLGAEVKGLNAFKIQNLHLIAAEIVSSNTPVTPNSSTKQSANRLDTPRLKPLANFEELGIYFPSLFGAGFEFLARPSRLIRSGSKKIRALELYPRELIELLEALAKELYQRGSESEKYRVKDQDSFLHMLSSLAKAKTPALNLNNLGEAKLTLGQDFIYALAALLESKSIVSKRAIVPKVYRSQSALLATCNLEVQMQWELAENTAFEESISPYLPGEIFAPVLDAVARKEFSLLAAKAQALPQLSAGFIAALANDVNDAPLELSPQQRSQLSRALGNLAKSGSDLHDYQGSATELVITIAEDRKTDTGANWLLTAAIRHETLYPLKDLLASKALSTAALMEYLTKILSLSPLLAKIPINEGEASWILDTNMLNEFLSEDAVGLAANGVAVLLPREWTKGKIRLNPAITGEAGESKKRSGKSGLSPFRTFEMSAAIGDTKLSGEELAQILAQAKELVQIRGKWVQLDSKNLTAAKKFLAAFSKFRNVQDPSTRSFLMRRELSLPDYLKLLSTPGIAEVEIATPNSSSSAEAKGLLYEFLTPKTLPRFEQPRGLKAELRPYQIRGVEWLSLLNSLELGGILADDMGLGKTMQVLAFLLLEKEAATEDKPLTLLISPMSVIGSWQKEAAKFAPRLRVLVHHGPNRLQGEELLKASLEHDLILSSYALIHKDLAHFKKLPLTRVILDEAQYVKNSKAQVTKAVKQLPAGKRIALTGTPVENSLTDLHSIFSITNPGLFDSEVDFKEKFQDPISAGDEAVALQLQAITKNFILRRVKTDPKIISDLPPKVEIKDYVNITAEQAGLYQALLDEMRKMLAAETDTNDSSNSFKRRSIVTTTLMKMKQVLNHPAHFLEDGSAILDPAGNHRSGKLERIDELLSEIIANSEKVLIFTQYTKFAPQLLHYWQERHGVRVSFLSGQVPKAQRDVLVNEFQSNLTESEIMLVSVKAGGTGITLTAANHVIHLDRWWNPAVENQATDRAYRIGQKQSVNVHKLIALGTVEEAIDELLESKLQLADATITASDNWLADLSDAALASLFSLRAPISKN